MQKTRLNLLLDQSLTRIDLFFLNPWRKITLIIIGFLSGIVSATIITTTAGQTSDVDIVIALGLLLFTETISIFVYRRTPVKNNGEIKYSLFVSLLNSFKIGMTFGLYFEAVKLAT